MDIGYASHHLAERDQRRIPQPHRTLSFRRVKRYAGWVPVAMGGVPPGPGLLAAMATTCLMT